MKVIECEAICNRAETHIRHYQDSKPSIARALTKAVKDLKFAQGWSGPTIQDKVANRVDHLITIIQNNTDDQYIRTITTTHQPTLGL